MDIIQLGFNLGLEIAPGGVAPSPPLDSVNAFCSSFKIMRRRQSVSVPPSGSKPRATTAAGVPEDQLEITFRSGIAAADFWRELYDTIVDDASMVGWGGNHDPGANSPDNPFYSGLAVLLSLDGGADVGALRQQTITLPIWEMNAPITA